MTMKEFLDIKLNQSLKAKEICILEHYDPLILRIFKSKQDYRNRGMISASREYKNIFYLLEGEFKNIKAKLTRNNERKQEAINKLKKKIYDIKSQSEGDDELIQIYKECKDMFEEDMQILKCEVMTTNGHI